MYNKIILVSPSLNPENNVSGISSVSRFIINNCKSCNFSHFRLGKKDNEKGGITRIPVLARCLFSWIFLLLRSRNDIIHYNFSLDKKSILRDFFFISIAKLMHKPMVLHLHGGKYLDNDNPPMYLRKMMKLIFSYKCPLIVLGNREQKILQKRYRKKEIVVLPNPVEVPNANINRDVSDKSVIHFLFLGRIETNKGIDEIYKSFSDIQTCHSDFVLHFAGKEQGANSYIDKFTELLGNKFIYEGVVSGNKKENLLKQCHVFLLPSYYEGLPMSLLESMSYGMVPIVTEVGSIGDYVVDGKNGMIVNVGDAKSLYNSVNRILENRKIINDLSKDAYETMSNYFSKDEYIDKLNDIYNKVRL